MKRLFSLILLAVPLLAGVSCSPRILDVHQPPLPLSCTAPPFLQPGDRIALISPAYDTPMENVLRASEVLRGWGFEPVVGPNVGKVYRGKYAGTPEERLEDIRWALEDPTIKAIICNRGGYGTIRLVDKLPAGEIAAHPKWLVGFSDITTLHGMESRAGVMSIHGTMCSFLAKSGGRDLSSTLVRDLLTGSVPRYSIPAHPCNLPGRAVGTLVGGNLCTFSPILGTSADATAGSDIILFIEEVEEDMSHIDRLFNTLRLSGVLDRCRGVILGEFTDCKANLDFDSVEEMLCSYLDDYGIPVCCGFPAGHGDVNLPLVMGATVSLEVGADGATLAFRMPGEQKPVRATEQRLPAVSGMAPGPQRATVGELKPRRLLRALDARRARRHTSASR